MSSARLVLMPLNYNGRDLLETCLPSMIREARAAPVPAEVWVIDNASQDDSRAYVQRHHPEARWIAYPQNRKLAAYNEAVRDCPAPYVLLLNNDVVLEEGFIAPLLRRLESDASFFAVSPAIHAEDPGECYPRRRGGHFFHGHLAPVELEPGPGGCLYFHGAAALLHRDLFLELGGFDSMFFYMEDNDLSYRAWRRGHPCVFEPAARLRHLGGRTTLKVHGGKDARRGLKERAMNLFVIKQVQQPAWIANFFFWTALKAIKAALTLDRARAWALAETLRSLPQALKSRRQQARLADRVLMEKISAMKLPHLK